MMWGPVVLGCNLKGLLETKCAWQHRMSQEDKFREFRAGV
eukprot:XP_001703968.1 Hypothetical protein GL50803_117989 [Giardia lamblia ATCC 50803]